jgi:hypothetical protein
MNKMPESLSLQALNRRDMLQLAAMFGIALSVPTLAAKAPLAPLSADEMALIGEVSELIIPATDTGGALAAGVPDFVKMMLSNWFSDAERDHFMSGLREFSAASSKKYGKPFAALSASQKDLYFGELLAAAEAAPHSLSAGNVPHTPFVVLMKRLTIFGYYSSELGATTELHQQVASAQYVPAAEIKAGDRADSGITAALYPFSAS